MEKYKKKIGFIGLGIMGKPMASHLVNEGFDVTVFDLDSEKVEELQKLGAHSGDYETIAENCDLILTILPNGSIVRDILFGSGNMAAHLKQGKIVVDHSSVTPQESCLCEEKLAARGVRFMDAPVSGGETGAIDGNLAVMCGGDPDLFEELAPYFSAYGGSVRRVGKIGSGSVVKLCNQIICNINIATLAEGLVFASKAGVDPEVVYGAIHTGFAGSAVMDSKTLRMKEHDFTPSATIKVIMKDIRNVLKTADQIDCPVPMSAQFYELLKSLKADGHYDDDSTSIVTYFEKLADTDISLDT
ncbi:MAG: NAD(P)-binding domain-containing protein, partial [Eubacteriales bacterium]|nr:NAD(P)-binding domain-containing protein [Eubacteriales bacterium]